MSKTYGLELNRRVLFRTCGVEPWIIISHIQLYSTYGLEPSRVIWQVLPASSLAVRTRPAEATLPDELLPRKKGPLKMAGFTCFRFGGRSYGHVPRRLRLRRHSFHQISILELGGPTCFGIACSRTDRFRGSSASGCIPSNIV